VFSGFGRFFLRGCRKARSLAAFCFLIVTLPGLLTWFLNENHLPPIQRAPPFGCRRRVPRGGNLRPKAGSRNPEGVPEGTFVSKTGVSTSTDPEWVQKKLPDYQKRLFKAAEVEIYAPRASSRNPERGAGRQRRGPPS